MSPKFHSFHACVFHPIFLVYLFRKIISIPIQDDYPENIDKMAETLSSWMEDETFLIKCLSPTDTSQSCSTARSSKQDSLLRLLLNVDELQPKLLQMLLEKLAEISIVDEGAEETQSHNIPRMILSSMRWLDTIIDGSGRTCTKKLGLGLSLHWSLMPY